MFRKGTCRQPVQSAWTTRGTPLVVIAALEAILAAAPPDAERPASPLAPTAALQSFQLHPDFRIELVAAEPLVQDPVAIAFDAAGRLFVAEYPEFNQYRFPPARRRRGKIKRLRDKDGDGKFDVASLVAEVPFPTGLIPHRDGLLVAAAPDLLFFPDRDDDGTADEKQVVLTGFGRDFAGGGIFNSLRWGLDNQIHMATGFAGGAIRSPQLPEKKAVSIRQRGLILNPRNWSFATTSGGGQFGLGMDDDGNKFLCSNVRPLQFLSYDDRYTQNNPFFSPPPPAININAEPALAPLHRLSPLEPWRVLRSRVAGSQRRNDPEAARPGGVFTSASGITVYRGDAFPKKFYGNLFVGEVANNLVYRARLEATTFGWRAYRADKDTEFLASSDPWFRPVQFANGPDGALYVVDMYRELIEGAAFVPESSLEDIDASRGTARGRIYRILPRNKSSKPLPSLASNNTTELVRLLAHRNAWHRETAARLLVERQDRRARPLLADLAKSAKHPTTRLHALYGLQSQDFLNDQHVAAALRDSSPRVRKHALLLGEPRLPASFELQELVQTMANDPSSRVRLQLAFTVGASGLPFRFNPLKQLLADNPGAPLAITAVQSALRHGVGSMLSQLTRDSQLVRNPQLHPVLHQLASQAGRQGEASEIATALEALALLETSKPALSRQLQQRLLSSLPPDHNILKNPTNDIPQLLEMLLQQAKLTAVNATTNLDHRLDAIRTLGVGDLKAANKFAVFEQLLTPEQPIEIQTTAAVTLARFKGQGVSTLLLDAWPRMTPRVRRTAVETLFSRPQWLQALLAAVQANIVAASEIDPTRIRLLLTQSKPPLTDQLHQLFAHHRLENRQQVIDRYQIAVEKSGDPASGKLVFKRSCASCHRFQGQGTAVGPDLETLQQRPKKTLLVDILDPSRTMKPQYQSYTAQTTRGQLFTGMVVNETANALTMQQADGSRLEILRIDIESLKSTGVSYMADGLEQQININAMADLLAFLHPKP
ncbi:MAG: PVC-type heme-binding CxxCH protein [Planctomycetota bacterium]|nr:PVC-type heme-binding CxxCH protein [Planctomycetota bacterium]